MNASVARVFVALVSGVIFGFGLSLSGMLNPVRVIGFLDVGGENWDPSLAFVLGGALSVAFVGMALTRQMTHPVLDDRFHVPPTGGIDRPLLLGSMLFGAGWGMAGFCPGPAVASLSMGLMSTVLFVLAMLIGMAAHDRLLPALTVKQIN